MRSAASFPASLSVLALLASPGVAQAPSPGARSEAGFEELARGFSAPPWSYAPFMFWFWDVAPPDPDQVEEMARRLIGARINPGYVHARPPIVPEFPRDPTSSAHPVAQVWLSEEWFAAFDRVVALAAREGAQVGFCDDVWWPSLRAAGRVLERHPELAAQTLAWTLVEGRGELEIPRAHFVVAARRACEPEPERPRVAVWIAHPGVPGGSHELTLAREFDLPADARIRRAELFVAAGGAAEPSIDGFGLGLGGLYGRPRTIDVTRLLRAGRGRLEVRVEVVGASEAGARVELRVEFEDGQPLVWGSDETWSARIADLGGGGRGEWSPARRLEGEALDSSERAQRPALHRPVEIESATLRLLGGGEPFVFTPPDEGLWRAYAFRLVTYPDVNRLDLRVGPAFVALAIEPYLERYAAHLGKTLSGVFVDNEGSYGVQLAWSDDLQREHQHQTGRDLRLWLPLLLDRDMEGHYPRARYDWFRTVSELYSANYAAVVERAALAGLYAIPNFWEESLTVQATFVGDAMRMQRRFTLPGNDCLGLTALDPQPFAEVRTVAELGGRRLMTEFLGAGRWQHFDPPTLKRATNAIFAWGVSHVVPHGVFLNRSLSGSGWTPDWYDENPLFRHLGLWSDFVRRASFVNAHGRVRAQVLLANPQESVWALLGPCVFDPRQRVGPPHVDSLFEAEVLAIDRAYADAMRRLSAAWVEFLVGDREILETGEVRDGVLRQGDFEFRTVLLPPLVVLQREVARRLVELARSGGHVLALGDLPRGSTDLGLGDPVLAELMAALVEAPGFARVENLAAALAQGQRGLEPSARVLSGVGPELVQRRRVEGRDLLWLANQAAEPRRFSLLVPGAAGRAALWDCERGRILEIASRAQDGGAAVDLELAPFEAMWLSFDPEREPLAGNGQLAAPALELLRLDGPWRARVDPALQPEVEIRTEVPAELGSAAGVAVALSPWSAWELLDERFVGHVDYSTSFELDPEGARSELLLDLGRVHDMAEVLVNGRLVGARLWPPHALDVTGFVLPGRNELVVRVGNLVQNAYIGTRFGFATESGLLGPVRLLARQSPASGR